MTVQHVARFLTSIRPVSPLAGGGEAASATDVRMEALEGPDQSAWSMCAPELAREKALAEVRLDLDLPKLTSVTTEAVVGLVRRAGAQLDADSSFAQAGLNSLQALQLRNALQDAVGAAVALPLTLLFEHANARRLVTFIEAQQRPASQPTTSPALMSATPDVSIHGTACKLPSADLPSSLHRMASSGVDARGLHSWLADYYGYWLVATHAPEF